MLKMDVVSGFEKGRGSVLNLNFFSWTAQDGLSAGKT